MHVWISGYINKMQMINVYTILNIEQNVSANIYKIPVKIFVYYFLKLLILSYVNNYLYTLLIIKQQSIISIFKYKMFILSLNYELI